jgi:hypothetical protein
MTFFFNWRNVVNWSISNMRGKGIHASFGKLCLGASRLCLSFIAAEKCFVAQQQSKL